MSPKNPIESLYRQPLLHFTALGMLVFLLYAWRTEDGNVAAGADDPQLIVVDRPVLLEYLQYQAQAFEPEVFEARLDSMDEEERLALANDFVREEALYREALKLGMEEGDYIIRQRLVQKVEFLLENLVAAGIDPAADELRNFHAARAADYRVAAVYTFAHIFFDAGQGGMEQARARALALQAARQDIPFDQAEAHGDRFPFLQNYVERTRDFVVNNFSAAFVAELDSVSPALDRWQGPFRSRYGYHLVLLQARSEPFVPEFELIRERVLDDFRYETLIRSRREAEDRVVAEYEVLLDLP